MNALVESLLAPAPEVDPEDATNFDDGTAARTSTGFKAGEDLAVIPKRRLVDDGEAPVGLAKSSRAELFDDGLDSGDDDVRPAEDDDDIDEAPLGDHGQVLARLEARRRASRGAVVEVRRILRVDFWCGCQEALYQRIHAAALRCRVAMMRCALVCTSPI